MMVALTSAFSHKQTHLVPQQRPDLPIAMPVAGADHRIKLGHPVPFPRHIDSSAIRRYAFQVGGIRWSVASQPYWSLMWWVIRA